MEQNNQAELINLSNKVLEQTMTGLMIRYKFLSKPLLKLTKISPVFDTDSIGTDGQTIFYNPLFVIRAYRDQTLAYHLLHVIFHLMFGHNFVGKNLRKNMPLWDKACDLAVDSLILDLNVNGLNIPEIGSMKTEILAFKKTCPDMTAERLYPVLLDLMPPTPQMGGSSNSNKNEPHKNKKDDHQFWQNPVKGSTGEHQPEQLNDEQQPELTREQFEVQQKQLQKEWQDLAEYIAAELANWNKSQGSDTNNLSQVIADANKKEKYDYDTFLAKFASLTETLKPDLEQFDTGFYTFGMNHYPEKVAFIEPLEYKDDLKIKDFVIAIDTSGSVDDELVKTFLVKTFNILKSQIMDQTQLNVHIVQCDSRIRHVDTIHSVKDLDKLLKSFTVYGRGDTDFIPVFKYIEEKKKEHEFSDFGGLIYFTDGYGDFPATKPEYPTSFIYIKENMNNSSVPSWVILYTLSKYDM